MKRILVKPVRLHWGYGGGGAVSTPFGVDSMYYELVPSKVNVPGDTLYKPYFVHFNKEGMNSTELSGEFVSEHIAVMYCQTHFNEIVDSTIELEVF